MKPTLNLLLILSLLIIQNINAQYETRYDKEMEALAVRTAQKLKVKKVGTVAVWFFHDTKGRKTELGDYIGRDFSIFFTGASEGFNVVDRDHIEQIASEHQWNEDGFIDAKTAKDVGKILAADAIVTGTVDVGLHRLRIRMKIINTTTGIQMATNIGNITINEDLKVILEDTDFDKPVTKGSPRINRSESENDKRTTNKKCETLGTGDYCFTNETDYLYRIRITGNTTRYSQWVVLKPHQDACLFDLKEGTYTYNVYDSSVGTITLSGWELEQGRFRIERCQSLTKVISINNKPQKRSTSSNRKQPQNKKREKVKFSDVIRLGEEIFKKKKRN